MFLGFGAFGSSFRRFDFDSFGGGSVIAGAFGGSSVSEYGCRQ